MTPPGLARLQPVLKAVFVVGSSLVLSLVLSLVRAAESTAALLLEDDLMQVLCFKQKY